MNTTPYTGFWKRAAAFILDAVIAAIPPAVLCGPVLFALGNSTEAAPDSKAAVFTLAVMIAVYIVWQILGLVSYWLYFAFCESGKHQATLGKRLLGIKVVGYDGGRISFARATGRLFAKFLSYATFYIGFIMAGTTNRKRALHDYIAQTYVVRKDFQPGDELPDTKSHPVLLGVIIGAICVLAGIWLLAALGGSTPAKAQVAAARLQQLSQEKQLLREPLMENGIEYTRRRDGYRANFKDREAEDYVLFLPARSNEVCCQTAPGEDCTPTGFEECN